jgi:hypothetical protein
VLIAIARGALAVGAAILLGGCGGGEEPEQVFTPADAARIANVRPVTPGWAWPQNPEKSVSSDSSTESDSTDSLLVELKKRTADLVETGEAGNKWRDDDKLGNLAVSTFESVSDAHEAMAAFNAFSRGWGERSGVITKDQEYEGLGEEAWVLWVVGSGTQVTYHWRRGNLVMEAHVHCFGLCPGDVDAATRGWVDAIDEAARAGS